MAEIKNRATLDNTQFQAGLKGMQGQVQNLGQSLKSLPGIGSALSIAGIAAIAKRAMDTADEIDNLSNQMGLGIETVQAYQVALGEAGLEMGTLQSATDRLARGQAEALAGNKRYQESFAALGITQDRLSQMGTEELLETTAQSMGNLRGDANATAASFDLLGRNSERLRDVLIDVNRDGIQAQIDEYKALGLVIDETMIRQLDQAQVRIERTGRAIGNWLTVKTAEAAQGFEMMGKMIQGASLDEAFQATEAPVIEAMEQRESKLEQLRKERAASRESDAQRELESINERRRLQEMSGEALRAELQTKLKALSAEEDQAKTAVERLRIAREIYDIEGRISRIKEEAPEREERTRSPDMDQLRRIGANMRNTGGGEITQQTGLMRRQLAAAEKGWRVLEEIRNNQNQGAIL